jgi:hypothetical protein
MHRSGLVLACLFGTVGWSHAASPNPDDLAIPAEVQVKARALVRQLGSEDYPEREDAQEQLAKMGRLACPAIFTGATTDPDPEIRLRCSQLLHNATSLDIKARIDTFLADTKGEYEHDLPAWKSFRAIACNEWSFFGHTVWSDRSLEKAAREVFAELISVTANRRLLMMIGGSHVELTEQVVSRKQELYDKRFPRNGLDNEQSPALEDVTAVLFADCHVGSQYVPRRNTLSSLLRGSGFLEAARGKDAKGQVYRAIAAAWLDSRNEPREMYMAMGIASGLDLNDQVCKLSARLLSMPGVTAMYRNRAAYYLAYHGEKRHIPLLAGAANNATVVASVRPLAFAENVPPEAYAEIQVRDVALAASIIMAGEKPAEFGFTDRQPDTTEKSNFSTTRYYFEDDAARKKAVAKWAEWRKANAEK